jgi:hypothetical protein
LRHNTVVQHISEDIICYVSSWGKKTVQSLYFSLDGGVVVVTGMAMKKNINFEGWRKHAVYFIYFYVTPLK